MADTKISDLTDGAPAVGTDIYPVARSGTNRRLTLANMLVAGDSPITGTTITATTKFVGPAGTTIGRSILGKSGIPFIGLSSGSVDANGAITGITALPVAYTSAYCWFPANILATSIAAGWHYCTFSTTTAGTAFLNTYTSGVPTIPGSPTAVTDGKGAFTGDTGEEFGPTITVPAGSLGVNGALSILSSHSVNNTANAKTCRVRYSGNAGTIYSAPSLVSDVTGRIETDIINRGATNSQVGTSLKIKGASFSTGVDAVYSAVDTTAATTIVLSIQRATATDNIVIEQFRIEMIADGA